MNPKIGWRTILLVVVITIVVAVATNPSTRLMRQGPQGSAIDHTVPYGLPVGSDELSRSVDINDSDFQSDWVDMEKMRFLRLLGTRPCDILVVPMQNQHHAFDRVTRSIMTAQLAQYLASGKDRCVVDPYLASRALGEGLRRIPTSDIDALAAAVKAKLVISPYVGHDRRMNMHVLVHVENGPGASGPFTRGPPKFKAWDGIAFSDENPPFDVWQEMLAEVVESIGLKVPAVPVAAEGGNILEVPLSPEQIVSQSSYDALDNARRYQLLALLGPAPEFRATERLHEKAWLAAKSAPDSTESLHLRARALYHLGYRPAALALLRRSVSNESRVLHALLNGNLPEAQTATETIAMRSDRLMAEIEVADLALRYGREDLRRLPVALEEAMSLSTGWTALLSARVRGSDPWHVGDNVSLKVWLDEVYPLEGFGLSDILRSQSAVGAVPNEVELDLLPTRHINGLLDRTDNSLCCSSFAMQPQSLDMLDLISAVTTANLERGVGRQLIQQGLADQALLMLDGYNAEYAGHTHFSVLRAQALQRLLEAEPGTRQAERSGALIAAARSAAYWEQGSSRYTEAATMTTGYQVLALRSFQNAYGNDFPPKPYSGPSADSILDYTSDDASSLSRALDYLKRDQVAGVLAKLRNRFEGSPDIALLRMQVGGPDAAPTIESMRVEIAADPGNWMLYDALTLKLIEVGRYSEVVEVVKRYPGFELEPSQDPLGLANISAGLGERLFRLGAFEPAIELFELSRRYPVGGERNMLAEHRLHLLGGDYAGAMADALERVQRYSSPDAYRDYLELLFMLGHGAEAWPTFVRVASQQPEIQLWDAALIGHRISGTSDAGLRAWLTSDPIRSIRLDATYPALRLALIAFLMDRQPPMDLPRLLARIEREPQGTIDAGGQVQYPANNERTRFLSRRRGEFLLHEPRSVKPGDSVPSAVVLFSEAVPAMWRGDHESAVRAFAKLSSFYSISSYDMDFALPYFAWSAAQSGDKLKLAAYLDSHEESGHHFGIHLAKAFFSGLDGRHEEALRRLAMARSRMSAGGWVELHKSSWSGELFHAYQFAEACIWLFEATKVDGYRDMALAWARDHQRMQPAVGWAYALEARYTLDEKARTGAAGVALYLDRDSAWLNQLPEAQLEEARRWLRSSNPFLISAARNGAN